MGFPGALNALELFLDPSSTNCINERAKGTVPGSSKSVKHDVLHTSRKIPESKSKGGSMCLYLPIFQSFGPEMNRYPKHRDPMNTDPGRLARLAGCNHKLFGACFL